MLPSELLPLIASWLSDLPTLGALNSLSKGTRKFILSLVSKVTLERPRELAQLQASLPSLFPKKRPSISGFLIMEGDEDLTTLTFEDLTIQIIDPISDMENLARGVHCLLTHALTDNRKRIAIINYCYTPIVEVRQGYIDDYFHICNKMTVLPSPYRRTLGSDQVHNSEEVERLWVTHEWKPEQNFPLLTHLRAEIEIWLDAESFTTRFPRLTSTEGPVFITGFEDLTAESEADFKTSTLRTLNLHIDNLHNHQEALEMGFAVRLWAPQDALPFLRLKYGRIQGVVGFEAL